METIHAGRRRSLPPVPRAVAPGGNRRETQMDAAQRFVASLRAGAPAFAAAAGAESAVVREVVPPARHRRSRVRLVLRDTGGAERDLTFLGPAGSPVLAQRTVGADIADWLRADDRHAGAWSVPDADSSSGSAVDLTLWHAAS